VTTTVFDINDAGIQVYIAGKLVETSPAYAVLHNKQLHLGRPGFERSRLFPGWTNNRFWAQLNTESMVGATRQIRHHADLAFSHLESLWSQVQQQTDEAIFAVPGSFDAAQLGLLLGMARECGIPVTGLVDSSIAAVSRQAGTRTSLHLDIHLHYCLLTSIGCDQSIRANESVKLTEQGLSTLWDRWADIIANLFIHNTRFDPMHHAVTEQQLFNQIPGWIAGFNDAKSRDITLTQDQTNHSVAVSAEKLLTACASLYPQIVQQIRSHLAAGQVTQLFLSHSLKGLPGLRNSLSLLPDTRIIQLEDSACADGIYEHLELIRSEPGPVSHITNLKIAPSVIDDQADRPQLTATHLLHNNSAVAIGHRLKLDENFSAGAVENPDNPVCTIYPRGTELLLENHKPGALLVNDKPAPGLTSLQPGDRIQSGQHVLHLISVRPSNGA
jgi:hypothetical protein